MMINIKVMTKKKPNIHLTYSYGKIRTKFSINKCRYI